MNDASLSVSNAANNNWCNVIKLTGSTFSDLSNLYTFYSETGLPTTLSHSDFTVNWVCTDMSWSYNAYEIINGNEIELPNSFLSYSSH
jgi:hypothetical protein